MAELQEFLLDLVELASRDANGRKDWQAIFAVLPDDKIAAAQVFEIVGESAECAKDRIRVPTGFELNSLDLDDSGMKQVRDIDR